MFRVVLAVLLLQLGCGANESVDFPPGLEPLEDNTAGTPAVGELVTIGGKDRPSWGHGRARYAVSADRLWELLLQGDVLVNTWDTDAQDKSDLACEYEHCFVLHYTVETLVTVEWQEEYRFGSLDVDPSGLRLGMIRYQKDWGSDFIDLLEGSYQVLRIDDEVSELQMVQHLQALSGGHEEIVNTFKEVHKNILDALAQ